MTSPATPPADPVIVALAAWEALRAPIRELESVADSEAATKAHDARLVALVGQEADRACDIVRASPSSVDGALSLLAFIARGNVFDLKGLGEGQEEVSCAIERAVAFLAEATGRAAPRVSAIVPL